MLGAESLIKRIYEQTHEKINDDDPIVTLLIAQQILFDDFNTDLETIQEESEERLQKMYNASYEKSAVLTMDMASKIGKSIDEKLQEITRRKEAAKKSEYNSLSGKMKKLTMLFYVFITLNICTLSLLGYVILKK
ncbi:MAG: hypothetical protein II847_03385 [Ruminobacter sp.]|uniref:hypothetical protein n=1 Tax=Ruminobacter sp. TaxID=2774296 RepID=UPI00257EA750|nr:hypothetical protein [Ruminobacter sp.]MBQ3775156.1 hypothetical protein [Ruminobacter sp.]